ncbi:FERM domain-containing protein 1 [Caerostris extrusa]|uniref:FERM domain-containing protein 1 n=1 Tax=Caerostris extrusa TaxID=172846 RepID=A0AAV4U5N6_CAEEX|nr:FERM domain-containing protein 1 [Caerostris extrusa]
MPNLDFSRTISRFYNSYSMIFGRKTSTVEADQQWKGEKCLNTMRQSFHRALTTCRAPLPPGKKYVAVQFLTKELIFYVVDAKGKGQEIFDEATKHLGISDTELFGLAFYQDGDYIFIDLNLKVSKYAVRSWKTHVNGIGGDGQPLLILHLRVKYYVDCHLLINEKVVRHHYYLQLRENVKNYVQPLSEEKSFLLAALALQADFGNYNEDKHKDCYFEIYNYFPSWIVKRIGEDFILRNIPALHKDNAGLSRGEAQVGYIKEASDITAPHNLHFYKMRRKKGKVWSDVWLGIGDRGIHIYEEVENMKSLLSTFCWCDIAKLHFEKKKFEILSEGSPDYRRFTYFVQSEDLAKHLLWICRTTHHFHMANQSRVADLKKLELDGGKPYRESYIYTDIFDQAREQKQNTLQKNKLMKLKVENCTINFNGTGDNVTVEKSLNTKMSGWNNTENAQNVSLHHSMEVLPLANDCKFSSNIKYKSQSIPCLPDRSLTPYSASVNSSSHLWCPSSCEHTTPTSTLLSRSSCTSNTDSTYSSLSLSSSTLQVGSMSRCSIEGSGWLKCESFEELPLRDSSVQKLCISTFMDKHVQTASVYDAVPQKMDDSRNTLYSITNAQTVPSLSDNIDVNRTPSFNTCATNHFNKNSHLPSSSTSNINAQVNASRTTHSLESSTNNKIIDVKRSPSFNVCATIHSHKHSHLPSISNAQTDISRISFPETSSSNKIIDVKRSPSFNVCATVHCHKRSNKLNQQTAQQHRRTATRIGVSSLSRDQRLPLSLYDDRRMLACGSEPNLYDPIQLEKAAKSRLLQMNMNSRSEMCLNVLKVQNGIKVDATDSRNCHQSLPDVCNEIVDGETDFPCIPPPPAYRNDATNGIRPPETSGSYSNLPVSVSKSRNPQSLLAHLSEKDKDIHLNQSSPTDVLDIHQLRQRSRDLDLPLISALCNDHSLLLLPKTVPTCSRQRHLGSKDWSRFNRTTSLPNGDGLDGLLTNNGRPISWHVDSNQVPHWSEVTKPCSASWDYSIRTGTSGVEEISKPRTCSVDSGIRTYVPLNDVVGKGCIATSLPPTILTSFVKTPVKQSRNVREPSSASDSYRYNKNQMIPTKLLAGSLGNLAQGRLCQKGLSS